MAIFEERPHTVEALLLDGEHTNAVGVNAWLRSHGVDSSIVEPTAHSGGYGIKIKANAAKHQTELHITPYRYIIRLNTGVFTEMTKVLFESIYRLQGVYGA